MSILVAVASTVRSDGVGSPGVGSDSCARVRCGGVHTYDWRAKPGSPENRHRITADYEVMSLDEALARNFTTDAMMVPYVIYEGDTPLARQPRLNKSSVEWVKSMGYRIRTASLWADLDNPGHGPWTPDLWTAFEEKWAAAKSLQTCGAYFGGGGARAFQPLIDLLDVEQTERSLAAWIRALELDGLRPDRACKAWNQNFRLPGARRNGQRYGLGETRLDRMVAIAAPIGTAPARRGPSPRLRIASSGAVEFTDLLPERWTPARIETLARAVRAELGEWHSLFLALAGALFDRREPPGDLPAILRAVSIATGADSRTEDRTRSAQTTVQRAQNGQPYAGYGALRREWPAVADAVDTVTADGAELRVLRQLARPSPPPVPLSEALDTLRREIAEPYGVTLIAGPPGLGKTRAVIERARRLPVIDERAAPGSRIALSVPRHDLAEQVLQQIPDRAMRLFGPLSHRTDGEPTCIHVTAATPLVAGGQSLEREFCTGRGNRDAACSQAETCPARHGVQGPKNANLALGPHALGRELSSLAGVAGALYVDELPPPVLSHRLSIDSIETALRFLDAFTPEYEQAIRPALVALLAWTRDIAANEESIPLTDALRAGCAVIPRDVLEMASIDPATPSADLPDLVLVRAAEAINEDARSKAPPVRWPQMARARTNAPRAAELGAASAVLDVLWRAITARNLPLPRIRLDLLGEERTAVVTRLNDEHIAAIRRQGPVVGLDANAHLAVEVYEKILGFRPKLVQLVVADGAPVDRVVFATASANRRTWLPRGVPDWNAGLLGALRSIIAWANEAPRAERLAIIAPTAVETAILATLRPDDPETLSRCKDARMGPQALAQARTLLAPVLAAFHGEIRTGHYGAVTGMDHMADCDALATLMDPRPNLSEVIDHATFLGLDPGGRLDLLAAAELQQAHGRLRLIHRTRPAKALHVGEIVPNGWQRLPVAVKGIAAGRPRHEAAMTPDEFREARSVLGMGVREFAKALGISHQTVARWETGAERGGAIRPDVAAAVRALVPGLVSEFTKSGPQTPCKKNTYRGFVDQFLSTPPIGDDREGPPDIGPPLQGVCGPLPATGGLWTTNPSQETPR